MPALGEPPIPAVPISAPARIARDARKTVTRRRNAAAWAGRSIVQCQMTGDGARQASIRRLFSCEARLGGVAGALAPAVKITRLRPNAVTAVAAEAAAAE